MNVITTTSRIDLQFQEQEYFRHKMLDYFKKGDLPKEFLPYFNWKTGLQNINDININVIYKMRELAQELLEFYYDKYPEAFTNVEIYHYEPSNYDIEESIWCSYKGFKNDKYIVSYLEAIDGELCGIIASK